MIILYNKGEYPDLNREHAMPHIAVLPIELYLPYITIYSLPRFIPAAAKRVIFFYLLYPPFGLWPLPNRAKAKVK